MDPTYGFPVLDAGHGGSGGTRNCPIPYAAIWGGIVRDWSGGSTYWYGKCPDCAYALACGVGSDTCVEEVILGDNGRGGAVGGWTVLWKG